MLTEISKNIDLDIKYQAFLSQYTTFKLGGECKGLITCRTPKQIEEVSKYLLSNKIEFIVIGGGSNIVVSDEGLDCYVVRYLSQTPIIERHDNEIFVAGCTWLDDLVQYTIDNGLEGLDFLSGIPGTVAGAIAGNAGAFGKQISDVIKSVDFFKKQSGDTGFEKLSRSKDELEFSYRDSVFKKSGDIIISARFALASKNIDSLKKHRSEILSMRKEKHPSVDLEPCAGSFFRNIEVRLDSGKRQAAGLLLEQAGAHGLKCGGAEVFKKHANIIINSGNCKSQDVYDLSIKMSSLVKEKFNIELQREICFVGNFKNKPLNIKSLVW